MPALDMDKPRMASVDAFGKLLSSLLDEASVIKQSSSIEPALTMPDFADLDSRVDAALPQQGEEATDSDAAVADLKSRQFAIVEGASRDLFGALIASIPIDSPKFVRMWNFLDILSILSDGGQCDPALVFWLVEELLDSQTIAGCRHIFDFLESRRERMTAKNFSQKKLVILRSCNELLRRLSRAEDTAFCGRVFIFMFQCFPLGDRSSVNLRGEYHVENVTTYETTANGDATKMDVDAETNGEEMADAKDGKPKEGSSRLSSEELYPLLWSLQESFSQPTTLFDSAKFSRFKHSLEETMKAFESLHADDQRSLKRKRNDEDEGATTIAEAFNPKYLTSQDLFELEISDLSFRRHVLVQALITTDFLLSLSAEAKQKLTGVPTANKAVVYSEQLSEEDTKWATDTKRRISEYLRQGFDGPYFFRMVETVLARDKNWVFWKMASCPPIEREPVTAADFVAARSSAERMATSKRLRPTPIGAVSMAFLDRSASSATLDELRPPARYQLPELASFQRPIADDDFEIGMPASDASRAAAIHGKSSKSWRALRIAARTRLAAFDKIDDPQQIAVVFAEPTDDADDNEAENVDNDAAASEEDMPSNRAAVILASSSHETLCAVVARLLEKHRGVFGLVVRHTTRAAAEGESNGKTFHFVSAPEFNQLRDSDRLVEHGERDGSHYGTSTKAIDAVGEVYDAMIGIADDNEDDVDNAAAKLSTFLYKGGASAPAEEDDDGGGEAMEDTKPEADDKESGSEDGGGGREEEEETPANGDADMADAEAKP
ncbi:THO complex subunit 1 [Beauveria bassiana]|uniref:THO complex subunit 1 n=1 Tax=Beauveria bassiana TaxID=176275 RepID=A0A2N6P1X2_BEABA|nr:THO complex subunit 1 [Beauveria bassiana]